MNYFIIQSALEILLLLILQLYNYTTNTQHNKIIQSINQLVNINQLVIINNNQQTMQEYEQFNPSMESPLVNGMNKLLF